MKKIDKIISYGKTYSSQLGINLESKKEKEIFKWFLAAILFGKPIHENVAIKTINLFFDKKITSPNKILKTKWGGLVRILDKGSYVRYDYSTATKLLGIMRELNKKYKSLTNLYKKSKNNKDLEKRLLEFKGIGPLTVNIFLRELRVIWPKAKPEVCEFVKIAARNLKIDLDKFNKKSKRFVKLECALLRTGKNYCRKNKCNQCLFKLYCKKW